jgi:hypothetical protein
MNDGVIIVIMCEVNKEEEAKEKAFKGKKKGMWPWSKLRQDCY